MAKEEEDLLEEAREAFERTAEAEADNRETGLDDKRFALLGGEEQWPEGVRKLRGKDRPMITVNKTRSYIRQVVNDSRQNKPSIKTHPVDSEADPETAKVIDGLIRNIEYTSSADIAYDTAVENAVSAGVGYIAVDIDYAHDDTFEMDIVIRRIANSFAVYGDPDSQSADGSDWNSAFEITKFHKDQFKAKYPDAERVNWDTDFQGIGAPWIDDDNVLVASWWKREEVDRPICLLSDGTVIAKDKINNGDYLLIDDVKVVEERTTKSWRVVQRLLTGAEMLKHDDGEKVRKWPGKFIPLVPVYGDEFDIEGKRYARSLIHDIKDVQRNENYWTTTATELVALAPRVPYIGAKGSFKSDPNWETANTANHPFLEYDVVAGAPGPARQPLDTGAAAGAVSEAIRSSQNMKEILGMYGDATRQTQSPESGRALMARRREEDTATFHFSDNLRRSIRQVGRIVIDLIPALYSKERMVRVIGEDGSQKMVQVNKPVPVMGKDGQPVIQQGPMGEPIPMTRITDLRVGKYDLTVSSGPSFSTQREEMAQRMTEIVQAYPAIFPLIGDIMFKAFDWPGADEISERLKKMVPPQAGDGPPPEMQKMMQQAKEAIGKFKEQVDKLTAENQQLKLQNQGLKQNAQVEMIQTQIDQFRAMTERMEAFMQAMKPEPQTMAA